MISYPHPIIYTLLHQLKFSLLPAPYRYTPTHAPGYWVDATTKNFIGGSRITKLNHTIPFQLCKASVNSMREIDCLMVGPGALVVKTPMLDGSESLFHRIDAERIFKDYIPGDQLLITGVKPWELMPAPLRRSPTFLWPFQTDVEMPGICLTASPGSTWRGPEVGIFELDLSLPNSPNSQSTTRGLSVRSRERHSTQTPRQTEWAF